MIDTRKVQIFEAIYLAIKEVNNNGGELPGKLTSLFALVQQYRRDVTQVEFEEIMNTPLAITFPLNSTQQRESPGITIDLDPVVIPREELEFLTEGYGDEGDIVRVIKKYLLTTANQAALSKEGLSIEDVLNGRFSYRDSAVPKILTEWNQRLGRNIFFVV